MDTNVDKEKLRAKLRSNIGSKAISRTTKTQKEQVLKEGLAKVGIDKKLFDESMKLVSKLTPKQREEFLKMKLPHAPVL